MFLQYTLPLYLKSLRRTIFFAAIFAVLLAAHLCHSGVLWAEEDLPLAAALQMKRGFALYRDTFFDKPPLVPAVYLLWGVQIGWILRLAGACYCFLCCVLGYAAARSRWGDAEGYWTAAFLAFFLTFDTPSAVLPLAADLLLLAPHLASIWLAISRRPLLSGVAAGVGFLFNAKGVLVLASGALFGWPSIPLLLTGFAIPNLAALGWLGATGSFRPYVDQVWIWMSRYASDTFLTNPIETGMQRTLNWLGFHATLAISGTVFFIRERDWRFGAWLLISFAGVVLGWRFFPRYYFLLLPVATMTAARGMVLMAPYSMSSGNVPGWVKCVALGCLFVPFFRFGPRYISLATGHSEHWADLAMDEDSRAVSQLLQGRSGTLYVWGYRPEIFVYTGLRPSSRYLECQALTGVPADRHLGQNHVVLTNGTEAARAEVIASKPDIVIDGLGPYNPGLAISRYPDMAKMLREYVPGPRTAGSITYFKRGASPPAGIQ